MMLFLITITKYPQYLANKHFCNNTMNEFKCNIFLQYLYYQTLVKWSMLTVIKI